MIEVRAAQPGDGRIMFEMIRGMRMHFLKKAFMPECGSGKALDRILFEDNPGGTARGLMAWVCHPCERILTDFCENHCNRITCDCISNWIR